MTPDGPELIVRLGAVEVRTRDPLAVSTAWRLIATAVRPDEYAALGDPFVPA